MTLGQNVKNWKGHSKDSASIYVTFKTGKMESD